MIARLLRHLTPNLRLAALSSVAIGFGSYSAMSVVFALTNNWQVTIPTALAVTTFWLVLIMTWMVEEIAPPTGFGVPMFPVPLLLPQIEDPDHWSQPKVENGDRLVEAEMEEGGKMHRIVVLLKPNGVVRGYSAPLTGDALRLALSPDDNMPPEPS